MNEEIIFALTQADLLPSDDSEESKNYLSAIAAFLEQGLDAEDLELVKHIQIEYGDVSSNHILNFAELGLYLLMMPIEKNWLAIEAKLIFDEDDFEEILLQGNYRLLFQYPYQLDELFETKRAYCEFISVFIEK